MSMIQAIQSYVQQIVIFGILMTIVRQILPGQKYEKYIKLYTGILFLLLIFLPLLKVTGIEDNFLSFYKGYESQLQYDGMEQGTKEKLYERYEQTLEQQLQKVLEQQGYDVGSVAVKTDHKKDGELKSVNVLLQKQKEEGQIMIPAIEMQKEESVTKEEEETISTVKALVETMYQAEGEKIEVAVSY